MQEIKKEIINLLVSAGIKGEVDLTVPPNSEMGDFAFACFSVAKEWQMNPVEAAKKLVSLIVIPSEPSKAMRDLPDNKTGILRSAQNDSKGLVEKVDAMGPYVNFYLNAGVVANLVIKEILKQDKKYGQNSSGKGKKVLLEYPSNNTHKEFHIGHFRNVCIGNVLVQLYEKNGYKVYPVNYLNDFGNHVAKCLWGLLKFHKDEKPPVNKQKWLGNIYAEASNKLKENPAFAPEVAEIQNQLENHDKKLWPLFIKTRQWSIDQFEKIFKDLGVKHKTVFFEKDLKAKGQKIIDDLIKKGIAKIGEGGAIIIDLSEYNLDVALLRKSNGAGLYLTSDLPLAMEKFKKYPVDESIIITGSEQNFYFKQLYKTLELVGFKNKLTHISYGLVNLKEGKMGSRFGNAVLYEDLFNDVYQKLKAESVQRHSDWNEKKVVSNARILAMSALKFDMQKHEAVKNIIFDINEASSFEGFTGPYVLYVIARINSLSDKFKGKILNTKTKLNLLAKPEEKQLVLFLAKYGEVVQEALGQYNPSVVTRYCFDLAQAFNNFYNKCPILKAETEALVRARLLLAVSVRNVLENALGLLTIETVDEM